MKQRYYVHGDQAEESPSTYYCHFCDLPVSREHFDTPCLHQKSHYQRYRATLKIFCSSKNAEVWRRPTNPPNLFS